MWELKFVQMVRVTCPRRLPCSYMVKLKVVMHDVAGLQIRGGKGYFSIYFLEIRIEN